MLRDKLDRLSRHITSSREIPEEGVDCDRYRKLAGILNGEVYSFSNGSFVKIVADFEETYTHGRAMILDLELLSSFKREHFYAAESDRLIDPRNLLFFNMETTGLGGSGTVAFLIGFGSIKGNGFQVRQYFLPDFPDEEAMLEAVREKINSETVIVSYNGKSFDMPILTDRMIIQRVERNLEYADHIDLLHIIRRMYRRRLRDCTLTNVEDRVLDFHRDSDIPGHLVPSVYFNWLSTTDPDLLDKVAQHNCNDIVSLFFLMHHISGIYDDPSEKISEPDDILSLARILERRREHENVYRMLESFDDITRSHGRFDILFLQSLSCKRSGRISEAVGLWRKIVGRDTPEAFWAGLELAKHFEHRIKDVKEALRYALDARKICPPRPSLKTDVARRIDRLNRKISQHYTSK